LQYKLNIYSQFEILYSRYFGREIVSGEKSVFDTAIKILIWKIHCKTFKDICFYRYAYASRLKERNELKAKMIGSSFPWRVAYQQQLNNLNAAFVSECKEIPNKELNNYNMFGEVKAIDVDYDRIVYDTYDYLDKILGFQLNDIFYAAFKRYFDSTSDIRADNLAKYVKYGTDREREIMLLRYGYSFEEIEWINDYVEDISKDEIIFKDTIYSLESEQFDVIKRFVNSKDK
jgi:hypothetical protein